METKWNLIHSWNVLLHPPSWVSLTSSHHRAIWRHDAIWCALSLCAPSCFTNSLPSFLCRPFLPRFLVPNLTRPNGTLQRYEMRHRSTNKNTQYLLWRAGIMNQEPGKVEERKSWCWGKIIPTMKHNLICMHTIPDGNFGLPRHSLESTADWQSLVLRN